MHLSLILLGQPSLRCCNVSLRALVRRRRQPTNQPHEHWTNTLQPLNPSLSAHLRASALASQTGRACRTDVGVRSAHPVRRRRSLPRPDVLQATSAVNGGREAASSRRPQLRGTAEGTWPMRSAYDAEVCPCPFRRQDDSAVASNATIARQIVRASAWPIGGIASQHHTSREERRSPVRACLHKTGA
jgi:hypothetical protein